MCTEAELPYWGMTIRASLLREILSQTTDPTAQADVVRRLGDSVAGARVVMPIPGDLALELAAVGASAAAWAAANTRDEEALIALWNGTRRVGVHEAVIDNPALSAEGAKRLKRRSASSAALGTLDALVSPKRESHVLDLATHRLSGVGDVREVREMLGSASDSELLTLAGLVELADGEGASIVAFVLGEAASRGGDVAQRTLDTLRERCGAERLGELAVRTLSDGAVRVSDSMVSGLHQAVVDLWQLVGEQEFDRRVYSILSNRRRVEHQVSATTYRLLTQSRAGRHLVARWSVSDDLFAHLLGLLDPTSKVDAEMAAAGMHGASGIELYLARFAGLEAQRALGPRMLEALEFMDDVDPALAERMVEGCQHEEALIAGIRTRHTTLLARPEWVEKMLDEHHLNAETIVERASAGWGDEVARMLMRRLPGLVQAQLHRGVMSSHDRILGDEMVRFGANALAALDTVERSGASLDEVYTALEDLATLDEKVVSA